MGEALQMTDDATGRLREVETRLAIAARGAKRDPADVKLIAVSKTFEAPAIVPVLQAGQRRFGENRVQEAKAKWPALKAKFPEVELHLIGPLQSNKTKEAVELFDAIHSIDREKIARAVAEEMQRQGKRLSLFIQVNTGAEPQKAGVLPREAPALVALCRDELKLDEEEAAVHFAFLAKLAAELGLAGLSMGMSDDFETAIAFGATHVRVGSAIFGSRGQP